MNLKKTVLKKAGVKVANSTIQPLCFPWVLHQPTPPAKLQEKMQKRV